MDELDLETTLTLLGTAIALIAGFIYWLSSREQKPEPALVIRPPPANLLKQKKEASEKKEGVPVKIMFYSQTGTAEDYSQRLSEDLSSFGFAPEVLDVENYNKEDLGNEKLVIFLSATYGEGDPPDNAAEFHRWLMDESREEGSLGNVKYAVFGLGNKTYDKFNHVGKEIDKRIEELGGIRIFPLGLGDDDVNIEKDFLSWKKDFGVALCKEFNINTSNLPLSVGTRRQRLVTYQPEDKALAGIDLNVISRWRMSDEKPHTPPDTKNPYLAQILVTRELHTPKSERSCLHVEISTHGDVLSYLPGDHLGIYPENDSTMVHKLAAQIKADLNAIVSLHPIEDTAGVNPIFGPCTVKAALSQYYDITSIVRKPLLKFLAQCAEDDDDKKQLFLLSSEDPEHQESYEKFIKNDCRCPSDVIKEFKSLKIPLDRFLEILPKMQPRFYSISSSPNKYPDTVHMTAVLVDYVTPTKRDAKGVTTHWLSKHRADPEKKVFPRIPAFIRRSNFKLPSSPTPIIMVGPGTGVAPFRGFIQEIKYRSKQQPQNEVILFFGCRHPDKDYIYQEELEEFHKDGTITDLRVAFSRLHDYKVYVQHKMDENDMPERLWNLLQSGANLYLCGDARVMARDVSETLLNIVATKGNKTPEEAAKYIENLQNQQRYLSDVWS